MGAARTILVGDVHGCPDEFDRLLDAVKYTQGVDRLVLVGDLVARGPDSGRAVARAMACGAESVRGNHDEKVLTWWRVASVAGEATANQRVKLGDRHQTAVRQMRPEHFGFLESLPLQLRLPAHNVIVVHAGVDPSTPLDAQEPPVLMNIRSIGRDGRPTRHLEDTPWAQTWQGPEHLVFGHDARRGLQLERYATGLDTGCCYGRELTALVLGDRQRVPEQQAARRACLVSVRATRAYCPMGDGTGPE